MTRRILVLLALVAGLLGASPAGARAGHTHWLQTPGTCVADVAAGQTAQTAGGGLHRFHDNVHAGTPGTHAFAGGANPVSVGKGECP